MPLGNSGWTRDWGILIVTPFTCLDCDKDVKGMNANRTMLYGHQVEGGIVCDPCNFKRIYGFDQA